MIFILPPISIQLLEERICSIRSKFFPLKVDPFWKGCVCVKIAGKFGSIFMHLNVRVISLEEEMSGHSLFAHALCPFFTTRHKSRNRRGCIFLCSTRRCSLICKLLGSQVALCSGDFNNFQVTKPCNDPQRPSTRLSLLNSCTY